MSKYEYEHTLFPGLLIFWRNAKKVASVALDAWFLFTTWFLISWDRVKDNVPVAVYGAFVIGKEIVLDAAKVAADWLNGAVQIIPEVAAESWAFRDDLTKNWEDLVPVRG